MKLTTRGHYSVKALLDLCFQPSYGPCSVRAIAQRQSIPAPYLEKLLIDLRRAGLVHSLRGVNGGYQLARNPRQIRLGDILTAVGEQRLPLASLQEQCQQTEDWVTFSLWNRLHEKLRDALLSITLEDLYYDARSWQAAQGQDSTFVI
jgi:Rrf2 family transcriptional regulator, iron-sulfur cluster assembly transcription factor